MLMSLVQCRADDSCVTAEVLPSGVPDAPQDFVDR